MGNAHTCCATPVTVNKPEHRVLMVGLDGAGKTTTLRCVSRGLPACGEPQLNTLPTLSYCVDELKWRRERLLVWDVGGQDKLRSLWRHFYSQVSCLVFVLDSSDTERLAEAREELQLLLAAPQLVDVPLLVLANKQDLDHAASMEDIANNLQLCALDPRSGLRSVRLLPASAWNGSGLSEAMDWISEQCAAGNACNNLQLRPALAGMDGLVDLEPSLEILRQRCEQKDRVSGSISTRPHHRGCSQ